MEQIDVLFLYPKIRKVSTSYRSRGTPPLGLAYLAAICEREGFSMKLLDLNVEQYSDVEVANFIKQCNPKSIGVSFITEARFAAFDLFKLAKKTNPDILTMAGGPHATLCADDTLNNVSDIDFIVRGEGEDTFTELMEKIVENNFDYSDIKGISYREDGKIKHNDGRLPIKDLDSLPFTALDQLSFDRYNFKIEVPGYKHLKAAPVLTSRGCPFKCNFCATTKVWGAKWRFRSPKNIISELELLKDKYNIEAVWFVDDNFNSNNKRVKLICEELIQRNLNLKWICNIRVDRADREQLELMSQAGCISIEFGAESGSQRILDEIIEKRIKVKQIIDVDRWCSELGINTDAQFIISHPTETFEDAKSTINLMKSLKGKSTLQILKIYPGTDVEKIALQKGILPQNFSWAKDKGKTDYMPSITGDAPLFLDKLTLEQVTELMTIAWTEIGSFSIFYLVKKVLRKIRSPKEFYRLTKLGLPILLKKCRNLLVKQTKK